MRLQAGMLQRVRKEAALAVTQGWGAVPVDPQFVLGLLDAYEPQPVSDQEEAIRTLREQLRDSRALHKEAQRATQKRFADGVAEGRRQAQLKTDRLSVLKDDPC